MAMANIAIAIKYEVANGLSINIYVWHWPMLKVKLKNFSEMVTDMAHIIIVR